MVAHNRSVYTVMFLPSKLLSVRVIPSLAMTTWRLRHFAITSDSLCVVSSYTYRGKSGLTDAVCCKRLLYMVGFLRPQQQLLGGQPFQQATVTQ